MKKFFEQFKQLDILEKIVFIFCCFGMLIILLVFFYLSYDIFC